MLISKRLIVNREFEAGVASGIPLVRNFDVDFRDISLVQIFRRIDVDNGEVRLRRNFVVCIAILNVVVRIAFIVAIPIVISLSPAHPASATTPATAKYLLRARCEPLMAFDLS